MNNKPCKQKGGVSKSSTNSTTINKKAESIEKLYKLYHHKRKGKDHQKALQI